MTIPTKMPSKKELPAVTDTANLGQTQIKALSTFINSPAKRLNYYQD